MLARLRHRSFVGRHDQQEHIDPGRAREHVLHEILMTWHVDDRNLQLLGISREACEAEIDGDAALPLLFPAIGVDPGQGLDQHGFAVIDMSGGTEYDGFHPKRSSRKRKELSGR